MDLDPKQNGYDESCVNAVGARIFHRSYTGTERVMLTTYLLPINCRTGRQSRLKHARIKVTGDGTPALMYDLVYFCTLFTIHFSFELQHQRHTHTSIL
jgi:hypothetical protein